MDVIVDRCAALDVHKDTVMACVRKPSSGGQRRVQEVREFRTWTSSLRELRGWLAAEGVTEVAMEATGVYWRPVWHVLVDLDGVALQVRKNVVFELFVICTPDGTRAEGDHLAGVTHGANFIEIVICAGRDF